MSNTTAQGDSSGNTGPVRLVVEEVATIGGPRHGDFVGRVLWDRRSWRIVVRTATQRPPTSP